MVTYSFTSTFVEHIVCINWRVTKADYENSVFFMKTVTNVMWFSNFGQVDFSYNFPTFYIYFPRDRQNNRVSAYFSRTLKTLFDFCGPLLKSLPMVPTLSHLLCRAYFAYYWSRLWKLFFDVYFCQNFDTLQTSFRMLEIWRIDAKMVLSTFLFLAKR